MCWSGRLAKWASVALFFFPLVLGKKIVFLKSYSGGKPQFPPTCWNRILIFALGKRRLVTFLKTSTFNVWLMAGHRSIIFFFFSLTSAMFNFWLWGTSQLLAGRDIMTQSLLGPGAWEPPQPGFFVILWQRLGSVLFIYRHVQFRVGDSGCVCASVSVCKDS